MILSKQAGRHSIRVVKARSTYIVTALEPLTNILNAVWGAIAQWKS
jgi:hypothetical protein